MESDYAQIKLQFRIYFRSTGTSLDLPSRGQRFAEEACKMKYALVRNPPIRGSLILGTTMAKISHTTQELRKLESDYVVTNLVSSRYFRAAGTSLYLSSRGQRLAEDACKMKLAPIPSSTNVSSLILSTTIVKLSRTV